MKKFNDIENAVMDSLMDGPASISDLSAILHYNRHTVYRVISHLSRAGLVDEYMTVPVTTDNSMRKTKMWKMARTSKRCEIT